MDKIAQDWEACKLAVSTGTTENIANEDCSYELLLRYSLPFKHNLLSSRPNWQSHSEILIPFSVMAERPFDCQRPSPLRNPIMHNLQLLTIAPSERMKSQVQPYRLGLQETD